jgi:colanic acid/amylovoran biosynthesis glycosyltransferase
VRIAILISEFPSLNETFILDQITGLIDRGLDVSIYATAPDNLPKVHEDIGAYDLLHRTVYRDSPRFVLPNNPLLRAARGAALLVDGLRRNPRAALETLNPFRYGRKASSLSLLCSAAPFLNSQSAHDIVHCHFPANGQLAVSLRLMGAISGKIVTSFHGYNRPLVESEKGRQLLDGLFKTGDLFLVCSDHMKQWYEQIGWGGGRILVHRYGVQTARFAPRPEADHQGPPRLFSVGRLVEKKGFEYAILAVARLICDFPGLRYEIAGDGPERSQLESLIAQLGVGDSIRLLGWQERTEVAALLAGADVFLAPSVTSRQGDQEGIPLVLHEAMAQGLPVVSTRHTGIPELVEEGRTGFLVAERDVAGISDRLGRLLRNPALRAEVGTNARAHIMQFNDLNTQNDRLVDIYRQLVHPPTWHVSGLPSDSEPAGICTSGVRFMPR